MTFDTHRDLPGVATRMADIAPFHVMALLARARQMEAAGRDIVHMEIGEPDFDCPEPILLAGRQALQNGLTHYAPAMGLPALREAIAGFYEDRHRVRISPERIVVTPGASGALQLALQLLINPGDEVVMADPGYPCNRHFVRLVEGVARLVAVDADTAWQLSVSLLERHLRPATKAVMLATPSNPTGTVLEATDLAALISATERQGARVIVDEIYQGLVYGEPAPTALQFSDQLFVINSFSKYFGMTGWRLGWMVVPECFIEPCDRLLQNVFLAASSPAQHAALAAFHADTARIVEARRREFADRRAFLLPRLRELGFVIDAEPDGAFYIYADCSRFTDDSEVFCRRLLEEQGVAVTPGLDFGQHEARRFVRFAYTTTTERLAEGVKRIAQWIETN